MEERYQLSFTYQVYGLTLGCDQPLPGLERLRVSAPAEVRLELAGDTEDHPLPPAVIAAALSRLRSDNRLPFRDELTVEVMAEGTIRLFYERQGIGAAVEFLVAADGRQICASRWYVGLESIVTLLLNGALPALLRQRGQICIHASTAVINGQAVAFAGESGRGKSSLLMALAREGAAVLSDDMAVITPAAEGQCFEVQPGYPRVRLWPTSLDVFDLAADALAPVLPEVEKRFVEVDGVEEMGQRGRFAREAVPLAAIYMMEPRQRQISKPLIHRLPPRDGYVQLVANRSLSPLSLPMPKRAAELQALAQLATHVPVKRLTLPDDLARLGEAVNVIHDDLASCEGVVSPEW